MYKIHLHEAGTTGSRTFRVEDSDDSGMISLLKGKDREYGVGAMFYRSPFFKYQRLGLTALEAATIVYDDPASVAFIVEGLNAMAEEDPANVWEPYPLVREE